jgi:hypothetical protein
LASASTLAVDGPGEIQAWEPSTGWRTVRIH